MSKNDRTTSLFDRIFDVAVLGAGVVGYGAAKRLAASGLSVLLVEPSGDLLGEISRALEDRITTEDAGEDLGFLPRLAPEKDGCLEPPKVEVYAAAELLREANPTVLLYACPVRLMMAEEFLTKVVVATKGGEREIRARRWMDATEQGLLVRLTGASRPPRQATARYRSLILHSFAPEKIDEILEVLRKRQGRDIEILTSPRQGERRLRWMENGEPWFRRMASICRELRHLVGADLAISHGSFRDFPIYAAETVEQATSSILNLEIASPGYRGEEISTLAHLGKIGLACAHALLTRAIPSEETMASATVPRAAGGKRKEYDVVVAGVGTGGALAALASARDGARTFAFDLAGWPGGIGTIGGITAYFHGAHGGWQETIDARVQELSSIFTGGPVSRGRWHHLAKTIVLCEMMEELHVKFLGDAMLADVKRTAEGQVKSVCLATENGLWTIAAKAFIDSTGDGDLCVQAGAEFFSGRSGDGRTLAYSQPAFSLRREEGRPSLKHINFDAGWVDPTDPEDLSRARLMGLAHYERYAWDGAQEILALAPLLGLRQSRHIQTDYILTLKDLLAHTHFSDCIGKANTLADTHSVDFEFESDEMAFYLWTCRAYRQRLSCDLPYRMLLPKGLTNVWVACRAAGVEVDAAYGVRMQREMQRIGEVAGSAAALAAATHQTSRTISMDALQETLRKNGSMPASHQDIPLTNEELLQRLDRGKPGLHLWHLVQRWEELRDEVRVRLRAEDSIVSFQAAAICAMASDPKAEDRLLRALEEKEVGLGPDDPRVPGPYGELIDIPFWLQSVVFLRRIGSEKCLPLLHALSLEGDLPFNVLTTLALTVEQLVRRLGPEPELLMVLDRLAGQPLPDSRLAPSRSLWRTLRGEPQKSLPNDRGADTAQDHAWQLRLVIRRTRHWAGRKALNYNESDA